MHAHIKKHNISLEEYYHKHYPRYDLHTKELIKFKNYDQYFGENFNNKANLKRWLKTADTGLAQNILLFQTKEKLKQKQHGFCYGEVQLFSYGLPDISTYQKVFGSYREFSYQVGLPVQFPKGLPEKWQKSGNDLTILIDTREQKPLKFLNSKSVKLDFGDYTVGGERFDYTFVERKSEEDFKSTFGSGTQRFLEELKRCHDMNSYLFIVVEAYMKKINQNNAFSAYKCNMDFIWHNVRECLRAFPKSCQFVFVGNRTNSTLYIPKILNCGKEIWRTDLQYFINKELACLGKQEHN